MKIISYKRRRLRPDEDVEVYRNLRRGAGVWYSIRQRGRVVAHARVVALVDARFIVQRAAWHRSRRKGQRNVHAWVAGRIADARTIPGLWLAAHYDRRMGVFLVERSDGVVGWARMTAADGVVLNAAGLCVRSA